MSNIPAMIIDFEATDLSTEAQATQLGYLHVVFDEYGDLVADPYHNYGRTSLRSPSVMCKPDRPISFGAMAVSHITNNDVDCFESHKDAVGRLFPKGEAYIIGHNIDYDIQVAKNAGVDASQYKTICTQALARKLLPDLDSHSLGALTYAINMDRARDYCKNAHDAGWDVTFTFWLLEKLCEIGVISSIEELYLASEEARIVTHFNFGKHKGESIDDLSRTTKGREYLRWVLATIKDKPRLLDACAKALDVRMLVWSSNSPSSTLPMSAKSDTGESYHIDYRDYCDKPYQITKLSSAGKYLFHIGYDELETAIIWCNNDYNTGGVKVW
ncbi:DNA polymerase III subunit epsilon [Shewanella phage vB_SbaS_Y11]|nr:DNA polymerase III subunit epsilon [Shewanella phage vB_SbaS_Y11]